MEVEIKLRLPDQASHAKVASLLAGQHKATYRQENYFFDGTNQELSKHRAVLRLRFYNQDEKATLTLKGKAIVQDGIGRASELEQLMPDATDARRYLSNAQELLSVAASVPVEDARHVALAKTMMDQFHPEQLVCLGGFKNVRQVYDWEGFVLELDETQFEWGTVYEIELETTEPERVRDKLEGYLASHGVSYTYSTTTKFANFKNRTLL